ncbi:MAG: hypothetical protein BWY74_00399 [Firmicutes bacterium ADurb.Bin419]|nr:MAG: hypothetical protein BWY74_00399 [Firmicutes bacterium ADurb.Bin419]
MKFLNIKKKVCSVDSTPGYFVAVSSLSIVFFDIGNECTSLGIKISASQPNNFYNVQGTKSVNMFFTIFINDMFGC